MKLHWSSRSPFVRKVMVAAHELGLADKIEKVRTVAAMDKPNAALMRDNPLSKIPTLVLDDGTVLYDSLVICEYFDMRDGHHRLFPSDPEQRLLALRRHALGNGLLDLLVLRRNERDRPGERCSPEHLEAFATKTESALAALEHEADALAATPFDIGHIAIGSALSYLDFRYLSQPWRPAHPRLASWHHGFATRPSVIATQHVDG